MDFENISLMNSSVENSTIKGLGPNAGNTTAKKVSEILLMIIMIVVMMSLGCTIKLDELRKQMKRPIGIGIGIFSQFIVYPPTVFGVAHALQLEKWEALGMIILATCPGGHLSNIITYWSDGNVALSVTMTAMSTAVAIGMMPLNLWIYSRSWTDESAVVPYVNIIIALVLIVVPVPFGMLVLKKWPKVALWAVRAGSTAGFLIIIVFLFMTGFNYPDMFLSSWKLWFGAIFLPVLGLLLGYILSMITRQRSAIRRTIAIEVSSQNVALCITIIVISFPPETKLPILMFPLLFSVFTCVILIIFVICYQLGKRVKLALCKKKQVRKVNDVMDDKELEEKMV